MSAGNLNWISVPISWRKVQAWGNEHMLYIEEPGMAFQTIFQNVFTRGLVTVSGDEDTIHLYYYVAVPSANNALEENPNLYTGFFFFSSFSNGIEFVDLGNIKPADRPPMQEQAM